MSKTKTTIALFTYGGGMRGLIPAHLMTRIEEVTDLRMADMIDIFSGPSTGAILNAALNVPSPKDPTQPKFRARHMVRFYEREGGDIFPADRFREFRGFVHDFNNRTMKLNQLNRLFRHGHYNPRHLHKSLRALCEGTKLSQTLKSLIIPVYNIDGEQLQVVTETGETGDAPVHTQNNFRDESGHALWLKNMRQPYGQHQATPEVDLFDAIIASTAAPTYFPCHHFEAKYPDRRGKVEYSGIDGSIFDNPCISYHGAIRQHVPDDHKLIMVILGTGYTLRSFKKEDWNRFGGLGVVDPANDLPLINILFHASESALVDSFSQEMKGNLFVFNKSMVSASRPNTPNTQIDDASPENLRRLRNFSEELIEENRKQFEQLCHVLVSNRDTKQTEKSLLEKAKDQVRYFLPGLKS